VLNANSSETTKDTNFKSGRPAPSHSPDMTHTYVSEKWAWSGSRDPVIFWALNATSSKTAKDMNFKFGRRVSRDSPDMTPDNCFQKVGVVMVT